VLVSERKGQILPVDLEPTTMPPGLEYALAGIQHIEYYAGDPAENLKSILRSREALAVLPFDNISPDQETDYFSDGLAGELIARLSLVNGIELVSRRESMQYKGKVRHVRAIGTELGARYIVGGSVRRFQDSVRITVQLVDVTTGRPLWGVPTRAASTTSSTSRKRSRSGSSVRSSSS
jgi:TolB-like protein